MKDTIQKIKDEFLYEPEINNIERLSSFSRVVIAGMGGSHMAGDFVKLLSNRNIIVHKNYGLPNLSDEEAKKTLFIAVSFSGNTEETIDFTNNVIDRGYVLAVVSTNGILLEIAKNKKLPYVQLPQTGLPPRLSSGNMTNAILLLMQENELLDKIRQICPDIDVENAKEGASRVADFLHSNTPIIYASDENKSLAYYLKILLNESVKTFAFSNVFPELNHNEMVGFTDKEILDKFSVLILRDSFDTAKIKKRMDVFFEMIKKGGGKVNSLDISGNSNEEKILNFIVVVNWISYIMAEKRGVDPDDTSFIEEFKKLIV